MYTYNRIMSCTFGHPLLVMRNKCSPLQSLLTFSKLRRNATAKVREVFLRGSTLFIMYTYRHH